MNFSTWRVVPKAGFYQHKLTYYYTNNTSTNQIRGDNHGGNSPPAEIQIHAQGQRAHVYGGWSNPGIEASGKKAIQSSSDNLAIIN